MDMLLHKIKINKFFYQIFCMILYGGLFVLSFPPFNYIFCVVVSICGISLLILQAKDYKFLLLQSVVLSLTISFFGCYWIAYSSYYVMYDYWIAQLILIGFGLLYTLFLFPTFFLIYLSKTYNKYIVLFCMWIAWCMFDVMKLCLFDGFPWFMIASVWDFDIYMLQIASIVGEFGLSIITYGLLTLCFGLILKFRVRVKIYLLIIIFFITFILHYIGYDIIKNFDNNSKAYKTISLRLVQPNINQSDKQNPYKQDENFNKIVDLAFSNLPNNIDYIILPEVAFNIVLEDREDLFKQLLKHIPKNSYLLTGTLREYKKNYYNSFYILEESINNIKINNFYDKILLVPFGEFIPLAQFLPFINNFVGLSNLSSGVEQKIFNLKNNKFSVLICFEGVFPNNLNSHQIDWLLNISNEAWFNESIEFQQNNSLLKFRSIESGVPLVKVSNSGQSIVVDSLGRITSVIKSYSVEKLDIDLQLRKKNVVFSFFIHNFLLSCIIDVYVMMCLILFIYNRRFLILSKI